MKKISENIKFLLALGSKVTWNMIYENEQELIEDMLDERLQLNEALPNVCKGYEYT